jgi:FkbM family methyltransferase
MRSYSQFNIDLYLIDIFKDIKNGFFIEAGANDGVNQSNTYLIEKFLGWNGLLVEPNKHSYSKCVSNRNCFIENYALVSCDYKSDSISGDFDSIYTDESMMGGCTTKHTNNSVAKAIQLSKLLTKYNIEKVDFLSIDVEGYELNALNGLDLSIHRPKYILYEYHDQFGFIDDYEKYFTDKRYKKVHTFSSHHFLFKTI